MALRYITKQLRRQFCTASKLNDTGGHIPYTKDQSSKSHGPDKSESGNKKPFYVNDASKDYEHVRSDSVSTTTNDILGSSGTEASTIQKQEPGNAKENKGNLYKTSATGYTYHQQETYSPNNPSPSPAADYQARPKPDGYVATPTHQRAASPEFQMLRLGHHRAIFIGPYSSQSHASESNSASVRGSVDWCTPDIEVTISNSYEDPGLRGKTGLVRGATRLMCDISGVVRGVLCSLFISHEQRTVYVLAEHLRPVKPVRGDKVKVILGDDIKATGFLFSIEELEGVVKMDQSGDVKILPLGYLCRMKNEA